MTRWELALFGDTDEAKPDCDWLLLSAHYVSLCFVEKNDYKKAQLTQRESATAVHV